MYKWLVTCILLLPVTGRGQILLTPGTTTFNFLRSETGARPTAMAGAFVSRADDLNALWWNPAGLCSLSQRSLKTSYTNLWLDVQSGMVGYAQPAGKWGVAGGSVRYDNYGTNEGRDENGNETGDFTVSSMTVAGSFGSYLGGENRGLPFFDFPQRTAWGASVKLAYMAIDSYTALGVLVDAGIKHKVYVNKGLNIGFMVQNLGTMVKPFIDTREPMPLTFRLGVSYPPKYMPLTLSLDAVAPADNVPYITFGGEFTLMENRLFLRGGYAFNRRNDWRIDDEQDKLAGAAMGVGFNYKTYTIDYAFVPSGRMGGIQHFSLAGSF